MTMLMGFVSTKSGGPVKNARDGHSKKYLVKQRMKKLRKKTAERILEITKWTKSAIGKILSRVR